MQNGLVEEVNLAAYATNEVMGGGSGCLCQDGRDVELLKRDYDN
jgi:hypothetical protein